jgi:hypothetical protein
VGSVRRELLDHVLVLDNQHFGRLVGQYQGIGQRVPGAPAAAVDVAKPVVARPVLGGLHHDYRRAA